MSASSRYSMLHPKQDTAWAVEASCTLVVNDKTREVFRLTGVEQALWDCLELGYSFERVRKMLEVMGRLAPEEAERAMNAILMEWETLGLVEAHHHG
jgi:hypothetical protein